jgi:hypothetical protein
MSAGGESEQDDIQDAVPSTVAGTAGDAVPSTAAVGVAGTVARTVRGAVRTDVADAVAAFAGNPDEELAEDYSGDVAWRALIQGIGIGALTGALSGASLLLDAQTQPGTGILQDLGERAGGALALAIPGLIVGSIVGLGCALVPAIVLSTCRRYFRRRLSAARVCATSVTGLLEFEVAANTAGHGNWPYALMFCVPGAIGIALAAVCMPYVLTGDGFRIGPPRRHRYQPQTRTR